MNDKRNIIIIGMPGCGKSTLGKALASRLNRPFYDADDVIVLLFYIAGRSWYLLVCKCNRKMYPAGWYQ